MKILGIGGSDHDLSSCLLRDDEVLIAIEEERISREKHGSGVRSCALNSVDYCLNEYNYNYEDMDMIITSDLLFPRLNSRKPFIDKVIKMNHHLAHNACAYYLSGYDEAALLTIDGNGSLFAFESSETVTLGYAQGKNFNTVEKTYGAAGVGKLDNKSALENSLGRFYSFFNTVCGFGFRDSGKLMGLSSYGENNYIDDMRKFAKVDIDAWSNLNIKIDLNYGGIKDFTKYIFNKKTEEEKFKVKADIACSAQSLLEEYVFIIMNHLYEKTKCKKLCYSGGVAYNSVINGKILQNTPFEQVFIPPAAGDSGIAIGAALYGYYNIFGKPYKKRLQQKHAYTGKKYNEDSIIEACQEFGDKISYEKLGRKKAIEKAAECIHKGNIIGWFQGQSEIGPRALGNRSILADPRVSDMKDIINKRVKFRENFRPFAPVVLREKVSEYFRTDFPDNPFMLYVSDVQDDKKDIIPAVTHVDGTARLQTIDRETNDMYYDLIDEFYKLSSVPVLLNTSFNIKGKPIVETPYDAIKSYLNCDLDDLFIGDYRVKKNKNED